MKIIGVTVGTTTPKPNFNQTNPRKGDYIKNKPDFTGLQNEVSTISELVGGAPVSQQIDDAIATIEQYFLNIDYDSTLAFDTSEVIFGTNSSAVLGQAILGQMVLT